MDALHYLLVPDRGAGRKLRREIASRGARCGTVVGTWGELLDQACRSYLLKPAGTAWDDRLGEAARKLTDAFWAESMKADADGTLSVLDRELRKLLDALGPGRDLHPAGASPMSDRGKRNLADLSRLHEAMGKVLPGDLATIAGLLALDGSDAGRCIVVYRRSGIPVLSPWQEALLRKLGADAGGAHDPALVEILGGALAAGPSGNPGSALRHLQESLFGAGTVEAPMDDSVTCLAVRDRLECAEVAAGMVQKALAADPMLKSSEIGLLLPGDRSCEDALGEVFTRAGIPVSGLEGPPHLRNLGGEAVFHFLATRRRPAPAMALAALYSSPLMPWDESEGNRLAMEIMRGEFNPEAPDGSFAEGRRMVLLLREPHESVNSLGEALREFGSLLTPAEGMSRHVRAAREALESVGEALRRWKGMDVPWEALVSLVPQAPMPSSAIPALTREGVAIFPEDEEPWRPVRLLFVLGFKEGRYPASPERSQLFDPEDVAALRNSLGFAIESAEEGMSRRRDLFLRQIRGVGDRVVFLAPLRDAMGEEMAPSGTIAFMARLFKEVHAPEDLILTLERESHRAKVNGLAEAPPADPVTTGALAVGDPDLKVDLVDDAGGKRRALTPSSLETLMVSPLSWFLEREDIVPRSWAPEVLDPAIKGTLAHEVFEHLFLVGAPLPEATKIKSSVEILLHAAMLLRAPFLTAAEWYVERRNLSKEIETAALRWRELLDRSEATILGVETTLTGMFDDVPIRGRTDLLLGLPSGRIFVVDYKKSTSSKRRTCMEEGYDIQASLYRHMLRSGGTVDGGADGIGRALKAGAEIGVLYYMMDDQRALTDTAGWIPHTVSGVQELGGGISVNGEALVRERIAALRAGILPLNREDDAERFAKVGVKTYALDSSPLVSRFVHPAPEGEDAG
jgi:hypothetical protein